MRNGEDRFHRTIGTGRLGGWIGRMILGRMIRLWNIGRMISGRMIRLWNIDRMILGRMIRLRNIGRMISGRMIRRTISLIILPDIILP